MVTYHPDKGVLAIPKVIGRENPLEIKIDWEPPKVYAAAGAQLTPEELYHANKLQDNDRLLLIFMFAHDEEIRLTVMHPEAWAIDCVNKTNKEKKELLTFVGKDGNNNAFQGARAFIPSGKKWVFHLVFSHILPLFWGTHVCKRVKLLMTDGDPQEYMMLDNAITGGKFPNAVRGRCMYHLFTQSWQKMVNKLQPSKMSNFTLTIIQQACAWITGWFVYIESEFKFFISKKLFDKFLRMNYALLGQAFHAIHHLINNTLLPCQNEWRNDMRLYVGGLDWRTTSPGEGEYKMFFTLLFVSCTMNVYYVVH
jgi:hypothetical protein